MLLKLNDEPAAEVVSELGASVGTTSVHVAFSMVSTPSSRTTEVASLAAVILREREDTAVYGVVKKGK